ncbi:MAG: hypothetical protein Ct9H90mP4_05690 [Gammaproteobacteria bacterium]|nr:MAG: hypothetical protein Ct9H90mP4_05690 [Gammaproteobacteria bacterium]
MSQLNADKCFIFTDTETSGLDINFSQIIQVGSVVTDESLVVENEQICLVIYYPGLFQVLKLY